MRIFIHREWCAKSICGQELRQMLSWLISEAWGAGKLGRMAPGMSEVCCCCCCSGDVSHEIPDLCWYLWKVLSNTFRCLMLYLYRFDPYNGVYLGIFRGKWWCWKETWGDPNLHATLLSHEWSKILNFRPYPCPENGVSSWKPLSEMVSLCLCDISFHHAYTASKNCRTAACAPTSMD